MLRGLLRLLNGLHTLVLGTTIVTAVAFSGYSIWDNYQVYEAATSVQNEIRLIKPEETTQAGPDFNELRAVNPDVVGWITLDGTNVDYPVLQGNTNLMYLNKDVYGNFSLAGSIFLDIRNSADFTDHYNLIYGHNMDAHLMFGDLMEYKEQQFFTDNTTGTLLVPRASRGFKVLAVQQISAGTEEIFDPDRYGKNLINLADYIENNSIWYHADGVALIRKAPTRVQVLALATCSEGGTNDRTVLLLIRTFTDEELYGSDPGGSTPIVEDDPKGKDTVQPGRLPKTGDTSSPNFWIAVIGVTLAVIISVESAEAAARKRRNEI